MMRAANNAAIRSAIGLGQTDAPTFLAQSLTGQSLTGTQATSLVDLAATWNTTGNPSLIYGRVTNTNSGTTANLIDLGTFAGGSLFKVNKAGGIRSIPSDNSSPAIGGILGTNIGAATVALYFGYTQAGSVHAYLDDAAFILRSTSYFGFSSNQPGIQSADTTLFRDAAGILAQRNGVLKQAFRVYNTNLSTAPEWAEFDWITSGTGNTLKIGTNKSGDGVARPIDFVTGGVARWQITAAGHLIGAGGDGLYDIGTSGSVGRVRDVNAAGSVYAYSFRRDSMAFIQFNGIGIITLTDHTSSTWNRLQLGGTTSAYPALKRVGAELQVVIASTSAAINVAAVDADMTFIEDRLRRKGAGSPESVVTAPIGAVYHRTDGGASTTLYVKESGTGNTGWVAK